MSIVRLPDGISINEVRIYKRDLKDIPVRKCYFAPKKRRMLDAICWNEGYVPVYTGENCVYLLKSSRSAKQLPDELNVEFSQDIAVFDDLPNEIARRFVFAFVERAAEPYSLYRGSGWQLFSLKTKFRFGHYSVNIDIHDEDLYFSIFLNPAVFVLLPVAHLSNSGLYADRPLMKVVEQSHHEKMRQLGHSIYPARVGYLSKVEGEDEDGAARVDDDTTIYVKPTRNSQELIEYPAFALRAIATRDETSALVLNKQERRKLQPLSEQRLQETEHWVRKLFPDSVLKVNDREVPVDDRISRLQQASRYQKNSSHHSKQLWYPDVHLLFDSVGTKMNYSQRKGLRHYQPFDANSQKRPFAKIEPYLIMPGEADLSAAIQQFFKYCENGYKKRSSTVAGDDDFEGVSEIFGVDFVPSAEDDSLFLDDASLQEYKAAAQNVIRQWVVVEDKNPNRIAIVVVPDKYDVDDDEDPYIPLKKLFIEEGLPCQMFEVSSLRKIDDLTFGYGYLLWNFALNLYTKLGGKPWTLAQQMNDVHCLIGLGFGSSAESSLYVGIANVFDENGQWLSFASEDKELSDEARESLQNKDFHVAGTSSYKLRQDLSQRIVSDSLEVYRVSSGGSISLKVALHKNGKIYEPEAIGFLQALANNILDGSGSLGDARFALVSVIKNHELRLYGPGYEKLAWPMRNTVSRGSVQILNENAAVVATTGKNRVYYPGIGTPKPVLIERYVPSDEVFDSTGFNRDQMYSIEEICGQVLSLTQLHWGSTRNIRLPVTSEYAQRVAQFVARSQVRADMLLKLKKMWWL